MSERVRERKQGKEESERERASERGRERVRGVDGGRGRDRGRKGRSSMSEALRSYTVQYELVRSTGTKSYNGMDIQRGCILLRHPTMLAS